MNFSGLKISGEDEQCVFRVSYLQLSQLPVAFFNDIFSISFRLPAICFSAYSITMSKIIANFAVADRLAEAPVWG